ncbi:MAG: hypothetical protein KDJ75_09585 [Alphaproteobacteria bacterium]|nr:hypothetical protein [Alphaproteobacteria bacterium]
MVTNVQEQLIEQFKKDLPKTKSKFSVGTFLDGCRHDTAWSEYPADIESTATRWHCYRSDTRYAEAFDLLERDDGPVEVVIMIGDHFDDSLQQTIALAQKLHEVKGTRIFALTEASENSQVWRSLTQVSESAGGLALPMPQEDEVGLVVREIVQSVIYGTLGLKKALPAPETPFLLDVRDKITHNDSI